MDRSSERVRAHRFHHVSTDEVYGSLELPNDPAFTREHAPTRRIYRIWRTRWGLITWCAPIMRPMDLKLRSRIARIYCMVLYQFPEKFILLTLDEYTCGGESIARLRRWIASAGFGPHVEDHCAAISLALDPWPDQERSPYISGKSETAEHRRGTALYVRAGR